MRTRIWALLDRWLFGPASDRAGLLGQCRRLLRYPYAVVRDLARGEINLRAMSLVYTTLLSLIPLLAFSFAILKAFGRHHDVEQPRGFARRLAEYTSLLIAGPVLLVGFIGLSHAALSSAPLQEMARLPLLHRLRGTGIALAPYVMVTAFFTAAYLMIPNTRVKWRAALTGALVGGVLWAAVGKTFTAFVVYSTRLTLVYAGFAVVVAALLWTYFGWLILLAGAQLSFYVQNPAYLRLGLQPLRLSAAELEELSLRLMYFVGRAHAAGSRLWSVSRLAAQLGLTGIAVGPTAHPLQRAGLLVVTERGELLPARDMRNIRVQEILDIARRQGSGHVAPRQLPIPAVDRLLAGLDEARRHRCGELTLGELVDEATRPALQLAPRQSGASK